MPRTRASLLLTYLGFAVAAVVFLGPVIYMVWSSLRANSDIVSSTFSWGAGLTATHFVELFRSLAFGRYLVNSIVVAAGSTLLGVVIALPAAYVTARLRLRALPLFILVARMAPGVLFVIPLFLMSTLVGAQSNDLYNYLALIFAHLIITMPLSLWLLVPYFEAIPKSLEEAAVMDGCSLHQRFARVALPLVVPGVAVAVSLSFILSWNYFLFALTLSNSRTVTMPVIAFRFIGEGQSNWGGLMAASVLISAPTFLLTALAQRWLVGGLTAGAVK